MQSTPVPAYEATVSRVMPPDTSSSGRWGAASAAATQARTSAGVMLSSSRASAPAARASSTWSRRSHSTWTVRAGHIPRARATASAMPNRAMWLSLRRIQSERLPRWLAPPPALTAAFSSARRPGVVLRVSQIRAVPPVAATSTKVRVRVAIPTGDRGS